MLLLPLSLSQRWNLLTMLIIVHSSFDFHGTHINVTVTNKTEAVRRWIRNHCYNNKNHLGRRRLIIVGLGLGKGDSVSTVHLCVSNECLIIQLDQLLEARRRHRRDLGLPNILLKQFSNENIQFVGIFNGGHANKLEKAGIQVANIHDLKDFLPSQVNRSYKQVLEASRIGRSYHGFDLDPAITNSDWSKPDLDGPQITQAAADAFVRYKIGVERVR